MKKSAQKVPFSLPLHPPSLSTHPKIPPIDSFCHLILQKPDYLVTMSFQKFLLAHLLMIMASLGASAQVSFSADVTSGCAPLAVNFTANAPGATGYFWDFGSGTGSTLANPGKIYQSGGTFTVTLTVTYPSGPPTTVTQTAFIQVFDPPSADFTGNPTQICLGNTIQFTDNTAPGSGAISNWTWSFGDGTISSFQNPSHNYQSAGIYSVSLQVNDVNGCSDLAFKSTYIRVDGPDASFSFGQVVACNPPLTVQFTSTGTTTGTHQWLFGAAGNSTAVNPTITFQSTGSYTVTHIVTDANGCVDTLTFPNLVNIGQNAAQITASATTVCPGDPVDFFCGSTSALGVAWNFGPGQGTSTQCNPTKIYTTPGTYQVTLTLTEPNNCILNATTTITVRQTPTVDFTTPDTVSCDIPHTVNFTNLTTGTGNTYRWGFGVPNANSTLTSPSYTYNNSGSYTVSLTVRDANGCVTREIKPQYIRVGELTPQVGASPSSGCKPVNVSFTNATISTAPITSVFWDFGDGDTSMMADPFHTYPDTGYYTITLIVSNAAGCTDTVVLPRRIQVGDSVQAAFTQSDSIICGKDSVVFTNQSTGNINQYLWDFGDGTTSMGRDPINFYSDTGYFAITLIVADRGCADTLVKDSAIYIKPVIAQFDGNLTGCDTPHVVTFQNLSLGGHVWHWDFGTGLPGDTSNLREPSFVYDTMGTYFVNMFAVDTVTGCTDEFFAAVRIALVDAQGSVDTLAGCASLPVNFTGSTVHGTRWVWSFDDGNVSSSLVTSHVYQNPRVYNAQLIVWNPLGCRADTIIPLTAYGTVPSFGTPGQQIGCAPHTVTFSNTSRTIAPVQRWFWDFGDGNTSTQRDPIHTYTQAGFYTVKLVAEDSLGCADSLTQQQFIYVSDPQAAFTVDEPINCLNNNLTFLNQSTGQTDLTHFWDFDDRTTSTQTNVSRPYTFNGTFQVRLVVTDSVGCKDTALQQVIIADPDIDLLADTTFASCPPLLVNFTGQANSPHNFNQWTWDFGDGNGSNVQNPSHLYTIPGIYDVSVIATNTAGCPDTVVLDSLITVLGPFGTFSFTPNQGCPGTQVTVTVQDSSTVSSVADMGDGTLINGAPRLLNFNHTYNQSGVYYPLVILDDGNGCRVPIRSTDSVEIYPLPQVDFSANQTALCDTGTVRFSDLSVSSVPLTNWSWDFGDGNTSTQQNPSHFYAQPGSYTVRLVVTTADGCVDSLEKANFIISRELPQVAMGLSDTASCQPLDLSVQDLSPPTNNPITGWNWDFGFGGATASTPNASFSYPAAGQFTLTLTLTDRFGCQNSRDTSVTVWPLPGVDFAVLPDSFGCAPVSLQFNDRVRTGQNWLWDFGDGNGSRQQDPFHTYQQDGQYDVKLVVTDFRGCTDSLTKPAYIRLGRPAANFDGDPLAGCPGLQVNFRDLSLSDTSLATWQWTFGDGGQGGGSQPSHTYLNSGSFSLQLIVEDVFGCRDTLVRENYVNIRPDIRPTPPDIRRVTVSDDNTVRIDWSRFPNSRNDFLRYDLYRQDANGTWQTVFTSTNPFRNFFDDTGLNTQASSYCYKLAVVNDCETSSLLEESPPHCSIQLRTTPQQDRIRLDWNAYQGWPVDSYRVYRVMSYSFNNIQLLGRVSGQQTTFTDLSTFCDEPYTYRIEGIKSGEEVVSWSNISTANPIHSLPTERQPVLRATVEENEWVLVEWEVVEMPRSRSLILERDEGAGFREIYRNSLGGANRYRDLNVAVSDKPYRYRLFLEDDCGERTALGREGRSIHLQVSRDQGRITLDWTAYAEWELGVARYELELLNEVSGQFEKVGEVGDSLTTFDDEFSDFTQGNYCYRVRAIERGGTETFSLSNEACVAILPQLFAPNAFTPNGDGINDEFLIKGAFLEAYHLRIFSRWGFVIFESRDPGEGWDGYYQGKEAPEGVYVFIVTGRGLEGSQVRLQGSVTVIR
jgi:gliding motility-associated-like protein